jgi:phosphate uptake regulator
MLFCAKNIERIGDHTTNIAETVYYIVEGRALPEERPKSDLTSRVRRPHDNSSGAGAKPRPPGGTE